MWGYTGSAGLGLENMSAGMMVFWVVIGLVFALIVRYAMTDHVDKDALEILKERYARGEINHDEFEARKHDLEQ